MHDPMTVAFEIKRPYPVRRTDAKSQRYWPPLVTVWHRDPESDGTDDSCGWFRPNLSKAHLSSLRYLASQEAKRPWFLAETAKQASSPTEAETLLRQAVLLVARVVKVRLSLEAATRIAVEFLMSPVDNVRGSLCFLSGWHSNSAIDCEVDRKDSALRLYCTLAREVLRQARPWWQHPRWHLNHWKIQVHFVLDLTRCLAPAIGKRAA